MSSRRIVLLCLVSLLVVTAQPAAARAPGAEPAAPDNHFAGGRGHTVRQILAGFQPLLIDWHALLAGLPPTYTPVVHFVLFHILPGRSLGLRYNLEYRRIPGRPGVWLACSSLWWRAGPATRVPFTSSCITIKQPVRLM